MTTFHTLHAQVTKSEDVRNRRRVTQQISSVRILADKSFLQGKGVLNPGQTANMFGSAEVLFLNSDQPVNVTLLDPTTDATVAVIANTRSASFDVADTGDSYKVMVEVSGPIEPATIDWFAFDNLTAGSITGDSFMLQQQVNDNIAAIAALQADLATLQSSDATNTAAILNLQTTITALQAQLTALDTTVQSNGASLAAITAQLATLATDITNLQAAVTALETAVTTQAGDITALQAAVTSAEATLVSNTNAISILTADLGNLQIAVTNNDNDILSLQQLMATTTQNVSDNTDDILSLTAGGWPFSFGRTLPENEEIAAFVVPYDMKIPVQSTSYARTFSSPASNVTMTFSGPSGQIGEVVFDSSGSGTVTVGTEVNLAKGEILTVSSTTLDGMEAPSFTIETERLLDGIPLPVQLLANVGDVLPIVNIYDAQVGLPDQDGFFVRAGSFGNTADVSSGPWQQNLVYQVSGVGTLLPNSVAGEAGDGPLHDRRPNEMAVMGSVWRDGSQFGIEYVAGTLLAIRDEAGTALTNIQAFNALSNGTKYLRLTPDGLSIQLVSEAEALSLGVAPFTGSDYASEANSSFNAVTEPPAIILTKRPLATQLANFEDIAVGETFTMTFPYETPELSFSNLTTGDVYLTSDQTAPTDIVLLLDVDGITPLDYSDPRASDGARRTLLRTPGGVQLTA